MYSRAKTLLWAAIGAALSSTASAQYTPGNLILGFTKGTTDLMFDLGASSQFVGATGIINLNPRISIGLLNSSYANDLGNLSFGVVGENSLGTAANQKFIYATVAHGSPAPNAIPNASAWNAISLNVDTLGTSITGSGNPANSGVADNSAGNGNSFLESIVSSTGNSFARNYMDPTSSTPSPFTSDIVEDLYGASANNSTPILLGTLTLGNGAASLTFTPVPEPTTSLLAGAGLLVLFMYRQFARKA